MHTSCKTATLKPVVPFLAEGEFRAIKKIAVGFEQMSAMTIGSTYRKANKSATGWLASGEDRRGQHCPFREMVRSPTYLAKRASSNRIAECDTILDYETSYALA